MELQAITQLAIQAQILTSALKNCEKGAIKHSTEETALLNFINLPTAFCSRLKVEEVNWSPKNWVGGKKDK